MKIEICEQMVQSWLQHIKQCEIVQTNWMISPLRLRDITDADIANVEKFMKEVQEKLNENLEDETKAALQELLDEELYAGKKRNKTKIKNLNIFKKSTARQFIRQCEIDVVGCKLDDGITERIYLVDTAFHKTGLGYHNPTATIVKKIVRALVVAVLVFGESAPVTVAFASPSCRDTLRTEIEKTIVGIRTILGKYPQYGNIDIELYFNEKFANDIYLPLLKEIDELNNDNDLFMRAMNLAELAEKNRDSSAVVVTPLSSAKMATLTRTPRGQNKNVVFDILKSIIKSGKMTPALLNDLLTCAYTKAKFNLSTFPMLVPVAAFSKTGYERCRYYPESIKINGVEYLVCSQWIPDRIDRLNNWYLTL